MNKGNSQEIVGIGVSTIKHIGKIITVFLVAYVGALTLPYVGHKKVSGNIKKEFQAEDCYGDTKGQERVAYINDNVEALKYRLKMISEAKEEVILSTFDFNADSSGKDVMCALLEAAERGVKVRVIVDGGNGFLDMKVKSAEWFQALASHENIDIQIYNPVNLLKPWKLQARLHDKYVIVDDKMYLLGGRNTTNLFLGDYSDSKNIDRELFVYKEDESSKGSIHQLKAYFESVWNLKDSKEYECKKETEEVKQCLSDLKNRTEKVKKLYPEAYEEWNWQELTVDTNKVTLLQNPIEAENKEPVMWYTITELMKSGDDVTVYTPYIICGKEMYEDLTQICEETETVEIITNDVSSGANPWGCTDYLNQKEKIWATGVQVYEFMGEHSSHTKAVLIDERMSLVGSYNMDMRSTYQDTELMLAVDSVALNEQIRQEAERDKLASRTMTESGEYEYGPEYQAKEMSTGKKIFYGVLRVITVPIRRFL